MTSLKNLKKYIFNLTLDVLQMQHVGQRRGTLKYI